MYSFLSFLATAISVVSITSLGEAASGVTTFNDYTTQSGVACSGEADILMKQLTGILTDWKGIPQQTAKEVVPIPPR